MRTFLKSVWRANIKHQMIALLVVFGAAGGVLLGPASTLPQMAIGVAVAVGLDGFIVFAKSRKPFLSISAIISGLIVAEVLPPGVRPLVVVTAAGVAIASKHVIRVWGRHVFNPAGFGLIVSLLLFRTYLYWWGGAMPWLVVVLGAALAVRFRRVHLVVSFIIAQWSFLGVVAMLEGRSPLEAIWMTNVFFVFVMLVEPKTSPLRRWGRILFGVVAGVVFATVARFAPARDPAIIALLAANALVPFINRWLKR